MTCLCRPALVAAAALILTALPAGAEPVEGQGFLIGCGDEGCFLSVLGVNLFAPAADTAPMRALMAMEPLTAVSIAGQLGDMGDSSATVTLTRAMAVASPDADTLRALQGAWKPVGEDSPFHIAITGTDWAELENGDETARFQMTFGPACTDGGAPGGTAISLYRYGDDPAADACWQVDYVDDARLALRDGMGAQGQVAFVRITD